MKTKLFFMLLPIFTGIVAIAQFESAKQVFESPKLKTEINAHKTVAILPFKADISYKRMPKNYDPKETENQEKQLSTDMQSGMYTYLLRKAENFTVNIQDPERTNALLKKAGYYDKLNEQTADSICAILKVDAIIKCGYKYEKTGSEAGAIVSSLLIGSGKVASGELTMQIYNGKDGELLWRFYKSMNEDVLSSANQVMERMMRKVGRNFPYAKD
jgi:hypothetical protein